jgi:hypothetical protein
MPLVAAVRILKKTMNPGNDMTVCMQRETVTKKERFVIRQVVMVVLVVMCTAGTMKGYASARASLDSAYALFRRHQYEKARITIERVYATHPDEPHVRFAYARIVHNGDSARAMYERLARDPATPDSLKAIACTALGEYHFITRAYTQACDAFERAVALGNADAGHMLRRSRNAMDSGNDTIAASGPTGAYAIQVGSFADKNNAEKLRGQLHAHVGRGRIEKARVKGTVYYRVYVTGFSEKDGARGFAHSELEPRGYTGYRIVRYTK